jgi:hypothetical protein
MDQALVEELYDIYLRAYRDVDTNVASTTLERAAVAFGIRDREHGRNVQTFDMFSNRICQCEADGDSS